MVYQWLIFAHVLGVFGFLIGHGASAAVAFKLRGERELARVRALLDLSRSANSVANACLMVLLVAGIVAGFMGNWWGQYWIWAAIGVLVLLSVAMMVFGSGPLVGVRKLLAGADAKDAAPAVAPAVATDADIAKQLPTLLAAVHPWLLTILGGGGLAIILWLMMFKPF